MYDRKHEKRLPMMAVNLVGLENAVSERGINKTIKIPINREEYHKTPIPYNMEFELVIGALYVSEIEQILEQILPFFDPYVVIRLPIAEIDNYLDLIVNFGSASIDKDIEIPEENYRVLS